MRLYLQWLINILMKKKHTNKDGQRTCFHLWWLLPDPGLLKLHLYPGPDQNLHE